MERNAQGPDRVPHADAGDIDLVRVFRAKVSGDLRRRRGVRASVPIELVRLVRQALVMGDEQPAVANEARKAAHRVSPSAEAEEKNLVAWLIIAYEPVIAVFDVSVDPAAQYSVENISIDGVNVQP